IRPASSTTSTPSSMVLKSVSRRLRSRARRCTTDCSPASSSRPMRGSTLSRKLDLLAMLPATGCTGGLLAFCPVALVEGRFRRGVWDVRRSARVRRRNGARDYGASGVGEAGIGFEYSGDDALLGVRRHGEEDPAGDHAVGDLAQLKLHGVAGEDAFSLGLEPRVGFQEL